MERNELLQLAETTFKTCISIMDKKGHDYAGVGNDALKNFKAVEFFEVTSVPTGVVVRLTDKFARVCNLLTLKAATVDESIEDTINDMINYLVILKASLIENKK